jgi:ribosomal protein L29
MKKHSTALAQVKSEDLIKLATDLRKEIADLTRGVRMGDVQNYKQINLKKKQLARTLTRKSAEERETK